MIAFLVRRVLQGFATLMGIMALTFLLIRLSPIDPVALLMPLSADVTPEDRERLRASLGLDDPWPVQLVRWMLGALRLDFGDSFVYHRPAIEIIGARIPNTVELALAALVLSLVIGIPLGVVAALHRGGLRDHAIRIFSVVGHAVPSFWFGLLVIVFFGVQLRWVPIGGIASTGREADILDRMHHLIGPATVLALAGIARFPRYLRTELLEVIRQDYIRTAHAKGLPRKTVVGVHMLRNALLPIVTLLGSVAATFLSGAVVVEQVFSWPGLGRLTFEAALMQDYPVIQGAVFISSVMLLVAYILRDLAYAWVDPRIRIR